ncbi:MAG: hypothetical protein JRH09_13575, partial [Deltaproteobacteria bacterium]|nr:hypothetical protein [Deltaproteobacteria bacterium]
MVLGFMAVYNTPQKTDREITCNLGVQTHWILSPIFNNTNKSTNSTTSRLSSTPWAVFALDIQWQIAYASDHKKRLLSPHLNIKRQSMADLDQIAGIAFECNEVDELRNEVLKHLERFFKSNKSNFVLVKGHKFDFGSAAKRGIRDRYSKLYDEHYWQFDPFFSKFFAPHPKVLSTNQLIPLREFTRGEYYNDFLKPQSLHHQMTMSLRAGKQTLGVLAIFRPANAKDFSRTEKRKFVLMAPLLAGALERTLFLKEVTKTRLMLDLVGNELPYKGILVLNEATEPIYINENAAKMMFCFVQAKELQNKSKLDIPSELRRHCQELNNLAISTGNPEANRYQFDLHVPDSRQNILTTVRLIKHHGKAACFLVGLDPK